MALWQSAFARHSYQRYPECWFDKMSTCFTADGFTLCRPCTCFLPEAGQAGIHYCEQALCLGAMQLPICPGGTCAPGGLEQILDLLCRLNLPSHPSEEQGGVQ